MTEVCFKAPLQETAWLASGTIRLRLSFRFGNLLDSGQDALDQIEHVERWLQHLERTMSELHDGMDKIYIYILHTLRLWWFLRIIKLVPLVKNHVCGYLIANIIQ